MSLERKDVRLKLHPEDHAALSLVADVDGREIAEWAEAELVKIVRKRIHAATVIAEAARRLGLSGSAGE